MINREKIQWGQIKKIQITPPYNLVSEKADVFNENYPFGEIRCIVTRELKSLETDPFKLFVSNQETQADEKTTIVKLYIEVPSLNNYRIQILKATYKISQLYPCELCNSISGQIYNCESMEQFKSTLDEMLIDESVSRTLSILFSQIAE